MSEREALPQIAPLADETVPLPVEQLSAITVFHQKALAAGAYAIVEKVDPARREIMEEYFTTDKSQTDIAHELDMLPTVVNHHIAKGLKHMFPYLPVEMQAAYKSPKDIVRLKSSKHTQTVKEHIRQGVTKYWEHQHQDKQDIHSEAHIIIEFPQGQ